MLMLDTGWLLAASALLATWAFGALARFLDSEACVGVRETSPARWFTGP